MLFDNFETEKIFVKSSLIKDQYYHLYIRDTLIRKESQDNLIYTYRNI